MLLLKKQQLQSEIQSIESQAQQKQSELAAQETSMAVWVALLAEPIGLEKLLSLREIVTEEGNIAGVMDGKSIPRGAS